MKIRRAFILALAFTVLLSATAPAQRRRTPPRRSASAAKTATAAEKRAGAQRVAEQIKTLTQFLYLLGGVSKGIEAADQAIRNREASPAIVEQNNRNKASVKESLANVRVGLEQLETEFSGKASLRPYFQHLAGVADIAVMAERQAASGQLDQAGKSLLRVVGRLTDALVAMREA